MNMLLKLSTTRKRIRLFHMWTRFVFFLEQVRMCLVVIVGEILQKWRWFYFFVIVTSLSCKAMCFINAKQHNCRFLVPKMNIQNVAASFALFTVVEKSHLIG